MARRNDITFTGLLIRNMLGTFHVLRGYAPLRDLAAVSVPFNMEEEGSDRVRGHQRELDERHAQEIRQYLEGPAERFLPEVILSVRSMTSFADSKGAATILLASDEADWDAINGLTIKSVSQTKSYNIWRVTVSGQHLEQVRQQRLIRRVDGNHRLEKALELQDDPASANRYVASFCMVLLLPPEYEPHNYAESLIFHTINSTALPLQSEHALKLILGQDPNNERSAEAEYRLNPTLHLTRLLRDQSHQAATKDTRERLGQQPLTSFHQAARSMVEITPPQFGNAEEQRTFAADLFSGLSDIVNRLWDKHAILCKAPFFLDLAARVWQQTKTDIEDHETHLIKAVDYLSGLGTWLGREGFEGLQEGQTLSAQILDIYEKVRSNFPKTVFMVRWYATGGTQDEKKRADLRFEQIQRALKELKEDGISLTLIDPATKEGGTYLIHPQLFADLASSDIVIVDLTGASANVHIEAGFALGCNKEERMIILVNQEKPEDKVPFDFVSHRYEPFTDTAEIGGLIKRRIKEIMRQAGMNIP